MENNSLTKLSLIFITTVLLFNAGLNTYWNSLPSEGSLISESILILPLSIISGIILSIYPLYKFNKKTILYIILAYVIVMATSVAIAGIFIATRMLGNPYLYVGIVNTTIPEYGIWHALYDGSAFSYAILFGLLFSVGIIFGLGLRWICSKIFGKKISTDTKIVS